MKAVIYDAFGAPPQVKNVPDPTPEARVCDKNFRLQRKEEFN